MAASNDRNRRLGTAYRRSETVTHWIRWDDPGRRVRRALCGALVSVKDHSNHPSCPACALAVAEREAYEP